MPTSQSGLQYRPDIDGLRAVAVLAVLFCHAELGLPGGYVGVDVFFVISGYLITGLIIKDLQLHCFSMLDFWERRARRILPALSFLLIVIIAAAWIFVLPDDFVGLAKSLIAVSTLSANIFFWRDIDYFAQAAVERPLLHTWSLAVEEQFYLFVPFGLALLYRLWRGKYLFPLLLLATLASLLLSVLLPPFRSHTNFYLLPTRAWELFAGSLLAIRPQFGFNLGSRVRQFLGLLGILLIVWPCLAYTKETHFPGLTALPPVLGAMFIIIAGTEGDSGLVSRTLASRPMVFIGLISYSLYLWHWPLLAFARYYAITPPSISTRAGLATASIPLAILSWKFIETPFRKKKLLGTRRSALVGGLFTLLFFTCLGCLVLVNQGIPGRLTELSQLLDRTGGEKTRFRFDYNPGKIPESLHQLGAENKTPSILVWGDSFSMALMPAANVVLKEKSQSGYGAGYVGMVPALNYARLTSMPKEDVYLHNQKIFNFIRESGITHVWLVGAWQDRLQEGGIEFESALKATVAELQKIGRHVSFVVDPPKYAFDMRRLLVRKGMRQENITGLGMTVADYLEQKMDVRRFASELKAEGVSVMDPMQDLLDEESPGKMVVYDKGGSFYSDGAHLSRHGAMRLRPMLHRWFAENHQATPNQ